MDEVLEIAVIDAEGAVLLNTLVRPVRHTVWPEAQAIHGITPQDVATARTWAELLPEIAKVCAGKTAVFYNAPFDTSFFPAGFFSAVACAMRRYSELIPERLAWVRLSDAASASGYISTGANHRALEDARACRHLWLFGIPVLEKAYPPIVDPHILAELALETGERVPVVFAKVFSEELRFVTIKGQCKLWTKGDREEINVYRSGTLGGKGMIATLTKAGNPALAERLAGGYEVNMQLKDRCNDSLLFEIEVKPSRKALRAATFPATAVTHSPIDDDIYKCFIAHRSGMCDAIGTWEEFQKVEDAISLLCKAQGGRFYKSKAKGAKFAIIFSPYAQAAKEVWDLQQEGYKVTSFDKALEYFRLEKMWDCSRYAAHVKSLNLGDFAAQQPV